MPQPTPLRGSGLYRTLTTHEKIVVRWFLKYYGFDENSAEDVVYAVKRVRTIGVD